MADVASLAENCSIIYATNSERFKPLSQPSLLNKPKGQRGRPTIQAKRQSEKFIQKRL